MCRAEEEHKQSAISYKNMELTGRPGVGGDCKGWEIAKWGGGNFMQGWGLDTLKGVRSDALISEETSLW